MTVLAVRAGEMAADSLVTCGSGKEPGSRYSRTKKIKRMPNGALLGGCGDPAVFNRMAITLRGIIQKRKPITCANIAPFDGVDALYLDTDNRVWLFTGGPNGGIMELEGPFFAEGSGCIAALAAFHCGADAYTAVEIAIELDTGCGGPVQLEAL